MTGSGLPDWRDRPRSGDSRIKTKGLTLCKKNSVLVSRVYQGYVGLALVPMSTNGSRTITLARYGAFEVRLVESQLVSARHASDLRIELYHRDARSIVDSQPCQDLEDAEDIAEYFLSGAKALHLSHNASRLSGGAPLSATGNLFDSNSSICRSSASASRKA